MVTDIRSAQASEFPLRATEDLATEVQEAGTIPEVARNALSSILPPRFFIVTARPEIQRAGLYPDELAYIERAVPKRQAEFGTARVCARKALDRLGAPMCSLLPHKDRSPRWPQGFVGSISHTEDCCAVAITRSDAIAGFGIDIESSTPLQERLEDLVCTENERLWLAQHNENDRARLGKLVFSAKEAVYKCQYGMTRTFVDFKDVDLAIDIDRGNFSVLHLNVIERPWQEKILRLEGRFLLLPQLIVTTAILFEENCHATATQRC